MTAQRLHAIGRRLEGEHASTGPHPARKADRVDAKNRPNVEHAVARSNVVLHPLPEFWFYALRDNATHAWVDAHRLAVDRPLDPPTTRAHVEQPLVRRPKLLHDAVVAPDVAGDAGD